MSQSQDFSTKYMGLKISWEIPMVLFEESEKYLENRVKAYGLYFRKVLQSVSLLALALSPLANPFLF